MKILQHLLLLSIFVAGCFFPLVWVILFILLYLQQDSNTKSSNTKVLSSPSSLPSTEPKPFILSEYIAQTKKIYLASAKWNTLRKQVLKRDQYTCQGCGINGVPLEVHHITYINYESEQLSDLVSVCRDCHQAIHDKHGYDYTNTFPLER